MAFLLEASGWMKFLGIISIASGVLTFFVEFPIGVITGLLTIVSGVFLVSASNALNAGEEGVAGENLKRFFVLQGILAAIALGFLLIALGVLLAAR